MNLFLRNNLVASIVGGVLADGQAVFQSATGVFGDGSKRFGFFRWWSVVAPIVAYLVATPVAAHAGAIQTVALTGQQAPGSGGVPFSGFQAPELNGAGQIAFGASLNLGPGFIRANDTGIWTGNGESLRLIAREGDNPPGTPPAVRFDRLSGLIINDSGKTAFHSTLAGLGVTPNNDQGIWSDYGGSLHLAARSGDSVPGAGTKIFGDIYPSHLDDAGQVALGAELLPGPERGLFVERSGALDLVFRLGIQVPGAPQGVVSERIFPNLGDDGEVAYLAIARSGPEDAPIFTEGIWAERQGVQRSIAQQGTAAPGAPAGELFSYLGSAMATANRIAFIASLENESGQPDGYGRSGIWKETNGSLQLALLAPVQVLGTTADTHFYPSDMLRLNRSGNTAFMVVVSGLSVTAKDDMAIGSEADGHFSLIARAGDRPPGVTADTSFESFVAPTLTLNNSGQVAFMAKFDGADVNWSTKRGRPEIVYDRGIWGQDRSGVLRLVVKAGDVIDVDDGPLEDFRRITELHFSQGFNDLGQLAFSARFTDGTSGVFLSSVLSVPEPDSSHAMLLASGAFVFAIRGNRKARLR